MQPVLSSRSLIVSPGVCLSARVNTSAGDEDFIPAYGKKAFFKLRKFVFQEFIQLGSLAEVECMSGTTAGIVD